MFLFQVLIFFLISLVTWPNVAFGRTNKSSVEMRIVDEPTSYAWNQPANLVHRDDLKMRVKPANVSGPSHLYRLHGKCFSKIIDKYKYEFCPFSNVTQHEQDVTWNPYRGVLGVWQDWTIADNQFKSMNMKRGTQCGANPRQAEVILLCGKANGIGKVEEIKHCEYQLEFFTPLVCHNHSLLVYPTLRKYLQDQWNVLLGELENEIITQKGYTKKLQQLFVDAGLKLSESEIEKEATDSNTIQSTDQYFLNLDTCNTEYKKLKKEFADTQKQVVND